MKVAVSKFVWVLLAITIIVLVVAVVYFAFWSVELEQVNYDLTLKSSIYAFPQWNITLTVNEATPELTGHTLVYRGQIISDEKYSTIPLEENDTLNLNFKFTNVKIASQENFTLTLWFATNQYMKYPLTLPEEISPKT